VTRPLAVYHGTLCALRGNDSAAKVAAGPLQKSPSIVKAEFSSLRNAFTGGGWLDWVGLGWTERDQRGHRWPRPESTAWPATINILVQLSATLVQLTATPHPERFSCCSDRRLIWLNRSGLSKRMAIHGRVELDSLPRQLLWRAVNNCAHVVEPEPCPANTASASDDRRTDLDVFQTEI